MTDELMLRLQNCYNFLEDEGHYTKANTVHLAIDRIKALEKEITEANTDGRQAMTDDLKRENQELRQQATFWQERAEYWRDLWSRAANRLLQVDPELSGPMTTKAEEIRKITQALKDPNPWKDV